jgi:hypothetical protein
MRLSAKFEPFDNTQLTNLLQNIKNTYKKRLTEKFNNEYADRMVADTKEVLTKRDKVVSRYLISQASKSNITLETNDVGTNAIEFKLKLNLPMSTDSERGYADVVNEGRQIGKPISKDGKERIGLWARRRGISSDTTKWKTKAGKSRSKPNRGKFGGPSEQQAIGFLMAKAIKKKGIASSEKSGKTIFREINDKTRKYILKDLKNFRGVSIGR